MKSFLGGAGDRRLKREIRELPADRMLLISVKVSSPVVVPIISWIDEQIVSVSGRWSFAIIVIVADDVVVSVVIVEGAVESSLSRSRDEVEVEERRGDAMSRLYVLRAETFALTVDRSPKIWF
jgi:hypothetical protein